MAGAKRYTPWNYYIAAFLDQVAGKEAISTFERISSL
jgi:hypothetical protein